MMQDEEYEAMLQSPERLKALGFRPQKEILTNNLLPYAYELDKESTKFLELVKVNFAKSVALREMKPACGIWSSRLMKYIRIYGLKFGKEDHVALTKLTYELVLIPDLEPCKLHKFATLFLMLTKKRHLLSPEDLTLPWRPLYDVGKKVFDKNATHFGMYHYIPPDTGIEGGGALGMLRKLMSGRTLNDILDLLPQDESELPTHLEVSYLAMVKCAKPYFDVSATKEILDECLPQINPCSTDPHLVGQLAVFLPVSLNEKNSAQGHELWFNKLMELWDYCYNSQSGTSDLMMLFSGLAKKNPGAVNWSPHIPNMFTRFLHALNLPVSYKDMQYTRNHNLDTKAVASWIVWSICPDGVTLKHLRSFLAAVESYLHSVNSGRWSFRLRDLLRKLAREFLNRVRRERESRFKKSWENQTPESYKLRDDDITEFVKTMLDPTLQAVYSRGGSLDISIALQNLATLRPAIVVPPLLERLRSTLTSLTEPHRVTAAMSAVAAVARPMLRGADADYPEGPTHVVPFLMAILPGLDPNDAKKTLVSLHFILMFSWMVPFIDCSSASDYWDDLTEEELVTCEATAQFEDFVLVFLDRVFTIVESSVQEQVRLDVKDSDSMRSKMDAVMETAISSAATAVLMQCSPKIFNEALRKFKSFATESTYETNVSGSMIGVILRVFARIDSESTLAAFVPKLCEELNELLETDEALRDENPPRDLVYRLVLLMHVVECDGNVLLKYMPLILPVLDRALKLHANYAINRSCEILSHILTSFCFVNLIEWRSSPNDYSTAPEKWLPIRDWGKGCSLKDANFKWHVPTAGEAECAQVLIDRYLKPEVIRLRQWLSGERDMCRARRLRCFTIIHAVLSCSTFMPAPDEEPVNFCESQIPTVNMTFANGVQYSVNLDGENVRVAITRLLVEVQAHMLQDRTDDTKGLEMLIQVWERVVVVRGLRSSPGLEARLRSYAALERALDGRGGVAGGTAGAVRLRMLLADAARLQEDARADVAIDKGATPSVLLALNALYDLSIYNYTSVRIQAQSRLYWMLSHYSYIYRALVPKLAVLLEAGGDDEDWHDRHKGALFIMLGPRSGPLVAKQDWEAVSKLWTAILKAPPSEKPSIMRLEFAFSDTLHRNFPTVNTRLTVQQSAVDAAMWFLGDAVDDPVFMEQLSKATENELNASCKTEKQYESMIDNIIQISERPNIQWRRLELAMQMLTCCPSLQTPYPPSMVQFSLKALLHENISVRRIALKLVHYVLKQRKRPLKKITVDPYEIAGVPKKPHVPGYRNDLDWTLWSGEIPQTDEEYDKPWLRSNDYGFFTWPDKLVVAAPSTEQIFSSDIPPDQMEAGERLVYEWFTDKANVDKLVSFLIIEDKKGKDKFNSVRFSLFRMLFSQFGGDVSGHLMDEALRLATATQDSSQRLAAELSAAALRAPRYWPRQRAYRMYDAALQVINAGLTSVTAETLDDWGTCMATGTEKLDPRRGGFIIQTLLKTCMPPPANTDAQEVDYDRETSFVVCAKLYALHGALGALSWRAAPLAAEILRQLEAANFIQHPYQNVRETVGSLLMTIFDTELVFPKGENRGPSLSAFLDSVTPRLAALYDENGDVVIRTATAMSASPCGRETDAGSPPELELRAPLVGQVGVDVAHMSPMNDDTPESGDPGGEKPEPAAMRSDRLDKELSVQLDSALRLAGDAASQAHKENARAVNLLTTVFRGCTGVTVRGVGGAGGAQRALLSTACALAARGPPHPHDELARAADGLLASLALALHTPDIFFEILTELERLAAGRSWWARLACLDFAQPLIFYGLPLLCERRDAAARAEQFALKLMRDTRLEVRQSAAKLLTGLMHCRALPDEDTTLRSLMRSCRSKQLLERHCGVLGLCAYLSSRPYSLGPKLGAVLTELSRHTNAPDPVPATIRIALADFRRTHHDDWPTHREQLTEEELDLLADLTSPPTYCA